LGAAYAAHEEKVKGSLEPGKLADLIVWAEDPYTLPLQRLYNATIDLTMVGGKIVYQKA
jgi:predicted amidohydrolase YtcJ